MKLITEIIHLHNPTFRNKKNVKTHTLEYKEDHGSKRKGKEREEIHKKI